MPGGDHVLVAEEWGAQRGVLGADDGNFTNTMAMKLRVLPDYMPSLPASRRMIFPAALSPNPQMVRDVQIRMERGTEYFQQERWQDALREFRQADRLATNQAAIIERIAVAATLAGDYETAEQEFTRYLEMVPDQPAHMIGLSGVMLRKKAYARADALLDRVLKIEPGNIHAHLNKLLLHVATTGDVERTINWLSLGIEQTYVAAQWLNGDRAEWVSLISEEQYRKVVEMALGPGTFEHLSEIPSGLLALIESMRVENTLETRRMLQQLTRQGVSNYGIMSEMARQYFISGDYEQAMRVMAALDARLPGIPLMAYNHGLTLVMMGYYQQAIDVFEREIKINPDYPEALFALACAYAGLGELNRAWPILEDLATRHPSRMAEWLKGEDAYLIAIRSDPRYPALLRTYSRP